VSKEEGGPTDPARENLIRLKEEGMVRINEEG